MSQPHVRIRLVDDEPHRGDGGRVLVERRWRPRSQAEGADLSGAGRNVTLLGATNAPEISEDPVPRELLDVH